MYRISALLAATVVVAGCQTTGTGPADPFAKVRQPVPEAQFKNGQAVTVSTGQSGATQAAKPARSGQRAKPAAMNVVGVTIDTRNADKGFGAAFTLDKARAAEIADQVITAHLEKFDDDSAPPVIVNIDFEMLYLAHGGYLLLGSTNSGSRATMSLVNKQSGETLLSGVKVGAGGSKRLSGLIGVALVEGQEQEMARVSVGVAERARKAIFGN